MAYFHAITIRRHGGFRFRAVSRDVGKITLYPKVEHPSPTPYVDPIRPNMTQGDPVLKTSAEGRKLPKNTKRNGFPLRPISHIHMHFQVWIAVQGLNADY